MTTPRWMLIDTWTGKDGSIRYARLGIDSHGHAVEPVFETRKAAYSYMRERKLPKGFRPVRVEMRFEVKP